MFTVQFFIDCRNILIILLITICICNSVMARRGKRGHLLTNCTACLSGSKVFAVAGCVVLRTTMPDSCNSWQKCRNKTMNKKIHSLALLVNLGIYGERRHKSRPILLFHMTIPLSLPPPSRTYRRLAFRPSPQMKSAKTPLPAMCRRSSVPCQALT